MRQDLNVPTAALPIYVSTDGLELLELRSAELQVYAALPREVFFLRLQSHAWPVACLLPFALRAELFVAPELQHADSAALERLCITHLPSSTETSRQEDLGIS